MADFVLMPIVNVVISVALVLAFLLFSPLILVEAMGKLRDKYRRYCPVHKVRLQYDVIEVIPKGAKTATQNVFVPPSGDKPTMSRASERLLSWVERYVWERRQEFPYANTSLPLFPKTKVITQRYCPVCRAIRQRYVEEATQAQEGAEREELAAMLSHLNPSERQEMEAKALREFEALEQVLDETMGNETVDNGDL